MRSRFTLRDEARPRGAGAGPGLCLSPCRLVIRGSPAMAYPPFDVRARRGAVSPGPRAIMAAQCAADSSTRPAARPMVWTMAPRTTTCDDCGALVDLLLDQV